LMQLTPKPLFAIRMVGLALPPPPGGHTHPTLPLTLSFNNCMVWTGLPVQLGLPQMIGMKASTPWSPKKPFLAGLGNSCPSSIDAH